MRNSDIAASSLGTISQSAFDRLNPADYPGAKVFVIGSAGAITEYSSLGTAWKQVAPFSDTSVAALGGVTAAQTAWLASSVSGDLTVNSRNGSGLVSGYTLVGTSYTVTYNSFGLPATVSGGGQIQTYSYDASGQLTGVVTV